MVVMRGRDCWPTIRAMKKHNYTVVATRLDALQAAIEALFEALPPDVAAAVRAGLVQRLDDLADGQPGESADIARAGAAATLLAALARIPT